MVRKEKPKVAFTIGRRKIAVARARVVPGTGKILINSKPFEIWGNEFLRMRIKEPLVLSEDLANKLNFYVNVSSGGLTGQTEAIRMAIARGIVEFFKDKKLMEKFLAYDRNMIVVDFRRTEPHKPSRSKAGPRRHKQRSKR